MYCVKRPNVSYVPIIFSLLALFIRKIHSFIIPYLSCRCFIPNLFLSKKSWRERYSVTFLILLFSAEDAEDDKEYGEEDDEKEPERADDDVFVDLAFDAFEGGFENDMKDAEGRSFLPRKLL